MDPKAQVVFFLFAFIAFMVYAFFGDLTFKGRGRDQSIGLLGVGAALVASKAKAAGITVVEKKDA